MIYSPDARRDGCPRAAGPAHRGPRPRAGRQVDFPPLRHVCRPGGGPDRYSRIRAGRRLRRHALVPGRHSACRSNGCPRHRAGRPLLSTHRPGTARAARRPRRFSMRGTPGRRCGSCPGSWRLTPLRPPSPATNRCAGGRCAASSSRWSRMGAQLAAERRGAPLTIQGRRAAPNRLRAAGPERAGQERRAPRRPADRRNDHRPRGSHDTRSYGARVAGVRGRGRRFDGGVSIEGLQRLTGIEATVPGDMSSATFWAVAAAALPGSDVELADVGLNPTRTALLDVLARAGAEVERQPAPRRARRTSRHCPHPRRHSAAAGARRPKTCRPSSTSCRRSRRWPPTAATCTSPARASCG